MTGGHKQFLRGHKKFNAPNSIVWTKKQRFSLRIFTNSEVKTEKKGFHLKKCANFHDFRGGTTKKKGFYSKICKKTVLAQGFSGDNQYFKSLRPRTDQWHRSCYFLWGKSSLEGAQFSLGGARPQNALPPRGFGPGEVLFWSSPIDEKRQYTELR